VIEGGGSGTRADEKSAGRELGGQLGKQRTKPAAQAVPRPGTHVTVRGPERTRRPSRRSSAKVADRRTRHTAPAMCQADRRWRPLRRRALRMARPARVDMR
jgi:hypothetical protein